MDKVVSTTLTRRSFVGTAGVAAAASVAGIATVNEAPSPAQAEEPSEEQALKAQPVGTSIYAQLNPQDYDYTSNSIEDFSKTMIFEPLTVGSATLNNRMVKSAVASGTSNDEEKMLEFYGNIAKGGIGGIVIEDKYAKYPHLDEVNERQPAPEDSPLKAVVAKIHEYGVPTIYQMACMGYTWTNTPESGTQFMASELSDEDIQTYIADNIAAAQTMQALGFDGVEINTGGNNLGTEFFSRNRNDRAEDDPYGPASIENRARIVTESIQGIKAACGEGFIVQVLMNGVEDNDEAIGQNTKVTTLEEVAAIAQLLEEAGCDSLHLRLGVFGNHEGQFINDGYFGAWGVNGTNSFGTFFDFSKHFGGHLDASHSGCGLMLNAAAYVKQFVSIPVGAVTYMDPAHAPDFFEKALEDGKIDFFLMNRPIANCDPEYPNKLREGRIKEIRPCCRCLHCAMDFNNHMGTMEGCRTNACKGRAHGDEMPEGYEVPAGDGEKNVMVIGGGPAGLEAARVCAERGYAVTLYEEDGILGGLLPFANAVKGPHENIQQFLDYLTNMLDIEGVTVETGVTADLATVQAANPDVVIVATGGKRPALYAEGTEKTPVISIDDFYGAELGENVTILGFNAQAMDTAWYLLAQGKNVAIVSDEPEDSLAKGQSYKMRVFTLPALYALGCRVWPNATLKTVGDGEVTITGDVGIDISFACDCVIDARDMEKNLDLFDEIEAAGYTAYAVGDCYDPWDIQSAVAYGNLAARKC